MKDLYKQLGVDESSGEADIRAALGAAAPDVREAAEFILLDPSRRAVYDRNRQVLVTVGRLRARLGLNLARFWPRARFADFTIDTTPDWRQGRGRPVDAGTMAWAFGVDVESQNDKGGRLPSRRPGGRLIMVAAFVAVGAVLWIAFWYWRQAR
jgi:hypothetical protein